MVALFDFWTKSSYPFMLSKITYDDDFFILGTAKIFLPVLIFGTADPFLVLKSLF